jgi:uncharacterized protein involved in exopolysaccharide biosynthesis
MSVTKQFDTYSVTAQQQFGPQDYLSLGDMLAIVWKRRTIVLIAAVVLGGAAFALSQVVHKQYDASVIVSPVSEDATSGRLGGLGGLVSQIGGIASVAGLNLSGNDHKQESLAILQSEALAERFIQQNNLLPVLFEKRWDPVGHKWKTTDPEKVPTLWKGYQEFKKIRRIASDTKTGLTTLTVTWRDAKVAADWADALVAMCNDTIRVRTITEAERNIAYLNEQLAKENVVAVQNSVSALLEGEIKKVMLARGSDEYAFRILDPARAPEKPSSPAPLLWTLGGLIGGVVISSIVVLIRAIYSRPMPRMEPESHVS